MMDHTKTLTTIAQNLRDIMRQQGLTATDVSKRCVISNGTVSKILNAQMTMSVNLLLNLATGLETSVEALLTGTYTAKQPDPTTLLSDAGQALYVGILTIGNKRITCVKDEAGQVLGTSELAGSLTLADTSTSIIQSIKASIAAALNKPTDSVDYRHCQIAAVVHCYEFNDNLQKYRANALQHFYRVSFFSDWQITYLSAFGQAPGISLVVDKGVSISYLHQGQLEKLGGWGFPIYDMGGAYWLGLMAVRHVIEAHEGFDRKSSLSRTILTQFDGKLEKLIEYCIKHNKDPDIYCSFSDQLLYAALSDEPKAEEILEEGYVYIERALHQIDRKVGTTLPISLNGSLADVYLRLIDDTRLFKKNQEPDEANLLAEMAKTGFDGGISTMWKGYRRESYH